MRMSGVRVMFKVYSKRRIKPDKLWAIVLLATLTCSLANIFINVYAQDLSVTANFADKPSITVNEPIQLQLNRPLQAAEGRIAVLIGQTDMTAFFATTEQTLS